MRLEECSSCECARLLPRAAAADKLLLSQGCGDSCKLVFTQLSKQQQQQQPSECIDKGGGDQFTWQPSSSSSSSSWRPRPLQVRERPRQQVQVRPPSSPPPSDHVVLIDVELAKHIVDLGLGHLVAPGLESVLEDLDVDLALGVVGLEGLHNHVVGVVALSGHLLLEHLDHVVIGAGTADLAEQAVQLALSHQHADVVEGAAEIVFVDGAILVDVHQLEAVLVHVKLLLGETSLILALAHGEKRCVESLLQYSSHTTPHVLCVETT